VWRIQMQVTRLIGRRVCRTRRLPCRKHFKRKCATAAHPESSEVVKEICDAMQEDDHFFQRLVSSLPMQSQAELIRHAQKQLSEGADMATGPQFVQYLRLALLNGVPMIGFGFVDNFVLIILGDYLDGHLSYHLGLSTLFAAGLANLGSDVMGLTVGGFMEKMGHMLGIKHHGLTVVQLRTWKSWFFKYTGMVVGVSIGCVVGMFPLMYPEKYRLWESRQQIEEKQKESVKSSTQIAEIRI